MFDDLFTIEYFRQIGIMTAHCNKAKLSTAINWARIFKLDELLCYGFMADVVDNWRALIALDPGAEIPTDLEKYKLLIYGSDYLDCDGKKSKHQQGLKSLWAHYAYAEYIRINHFDDTPNGLVGKSNEFSIPTPTGDINNFSYKYDNMAKVLYKNIKEYLCINKDIFLKFDACDCNLSCGCSGSCSCGKIKRVTGFKFKSVKKK